MGSPAFIANQLDHIHKYDFIFDPEVKASRVLNAYNTDDEPWLNDPIQVDEVMRAMCSEAYRDAEVFCDLSLAFEGHGISPHGVHHLMQEGLRTGARDAKHVVFVMPPEHGKTSQIAKFLVWMIGHNPRLRIGITSADMDLAKRNLIAIRKTLLSPLTRLIFPHLEPDIRASSTGGQWSMTCLYGRDSRDTTQESSYPWFEVYPFTGDIEGARLDICWMDDVVTRKCHRSEAEREEAKSTIHNSFLRRLTQGGFAIISNNCWHREDPIHQMVNSPSFTVFWVGYIGTERMYWRVHHPPSSWRLPDEGELPLWSVWPESRLNSTLLEDRLTYKRLYQQRAILAEETRFPLHEDWVTYEPWELPKAEDGARCYAFLDPAGGKHAKKDDFAALILVVIGPDRIIYVLDVWVCRAIPERQVKALWTAHRNAKMHGYPEGVSKAAIEVLAKDDLWVNMPMMAHEEKLRKAGDPDVNLDWIPCYPTEDKHSRIERINPHMYNGWIRFPAGFRDLQFGVGEKAESWKYLINHMEDFPFAGPKGHDDGADALSGAVMLAETFGPALVPGLERNASEIRLQKAQERRDNQLLRRDEDGKPAKRDKKRPLV